MSLRGQMYEVDGRVRGDGAPPYLVAELSGNHGQLLGQAKVIIKIANKRIAPSKQDSKKVQCRGSLFVAADIAKGELLTLQNLKIVKPSYGLESCYWDMVLRKRAKKHLRFGAPLKKGHWVEHESQHS